MEIRKVDYPPLIFEIIEVDQNIDDFRKKHFSDRVVYLGYCRLYKAELDILRNRKKELVQTAERVWGRGNKGECGYA